MPESIRSALEFLLCTGLTAGAVAGAVVWVSKQWLSEKIRAQIRSKYELRLESYKAQLKGEYDESSKLIKPSIKHRATLKSKS